jgi:hypothetical protein
MTYAGTIKQGVVVLEPGVVLAEGTRVTVSTSEPAPQESVRQPPRTVYERLKPLIGAVEGLPRDLAENHDHYLYGVRKRERP